MKEVKNDVSHEEILELVGIYKKMKPMNRHFMVSASNLLLASQDAEEQEHTQKVAAG